MRYRHEPAGGGIRAVAAVRAMSAVMRRAAARGAVPCRISPAVSFLRLVEYRFFFSSYRYEFPASSVPFWRLVPYSLALCMACHAGLEIQAAVFSVSLLSRLISSHCLIASTRLIVPSRLIDSSRLDTHGDTLHSIREAGRG